MVLSYKVKLESCCRCVASLVEVPEHNLLWSNLALPGAFLPILRAVRSEPHLGV